MIVQRTNTYSWRGFDQFRDMEMNPYIERGLESTTLMRRAILTSFIKERKSTTTITTVIIITTIIIIIIITVHNLEKQCDVIIYHFRN